MVFGCVGDMDEYWAHRLQNTRSTIEGEAEADIFGRYTPYAAKIILDQWREADKYEVSDETSAEDIDEGVVN